MLEPDPKAADMERVDPAEQESAGGVLTGTKWLLTAFAVLTLLAVFQLLIRADVADCYWAWTIPTEQSAAFVGAGYGAGLVLSLLSLRMTRWSRIRIPIVTVTVFTVLTTVATFVHMHRLHLEDGGPIARQELARGPALPTARPMPR